MHALIQDVIRSGHPSAIDYFERAPVERWYKAMVLALDTGPEEPNLFLLIFRDQSEARRIDRMRDDFVANASHELRTPLASLSGFIETLRGPARKDDGGAREVSRRSCRPRPTAWRVSSTISCPCRASR